MTDRDEVAALDKGIAEGIGSGDAAAVAANYSEDAAIHPPGAGRIDGKAAIEAYWQGAISAGLTDVSITPASIDITGDCSVTVGTIAGRMGDTALAGKYVVIGKRTAGGWKVCHDIWNFDA